MSKVRFGLENVHIAPMTGDGVYSTPIHIPGAVSMSLNPSGDESTFYADNSAYFTVTSNNGYAGDLRVAFLPDDVKTVILGYIEDEKGILIEDASAPQVPFALLYQVEADTANRRYALYNCKIARPAETHNTKAENVTPDTETVSLTAIPQVFNGHKCVKGSIENTVDAAAEYAAWFTAVLTPDFTPSA
jgi:phi13 family phage major tail protein